MKTFAPQYYTRFKCRADKCEHTCCAGWEIDVDGITLNKYRKVDGEMGERIKKSLTEGDGALCFALKEDKCPFLNEKGLCDIITFLGEDYLSQVCADHPRFRNFQLNRTEVGVGLTCEEACALVLNSDDSLLVEIADDGQREDTDEWEVYLLEKREKLFHLVNSDEDFSKKCKGAMDEVGASLPTLDVNAWREIYLSLERLDEKWTDVLAKLQPLGKIRDQKIYARVLNYMLFRHVLGAENDSDLRARVAFCVHATYFISAVAVALEKQGEKNADEESARLYSSEIEYSDDNLYSLIDLFSTINENDA